MKGREASASPWENECSGLKKEIEASQVETLSLSPRGKEKGLLPQAHRIWFEDQENESCFTERTNLDTVLGGSGKNWLHPWF